MKFLEKIKNMPESSRKIIFWLVLATIALILMFFWIKSAQNKFKNFDLKNTEKQLNPLKNFLQENNAQQTN